MATSKLNLNNTIDAGAFSETISAAGSYDGSVSFHRTFSAEPIVNATLSDVARGYTDSVKTGICITSVTTTGFTYRIKTENVVAGSVNVFWIAVGY